MFELIVFSALFLLLLLTPSERQQLKSKTIFEWGLDLSNLTIQGTLIPFLRIAVLVAALKYYLPQWQGVLELSFVTGFCLNFFFVDYLYYWNHRILHHKRLFPLHIVHHSVRQMDVMATSRNTIWTSFVILYLWVNGLFLYLTDFNQGFIVAMSLSAALDIWKHSSSLHNKTRVQYLLSQWGLMTPLDHAWHHSSKLNCNYGANLNLYDRFHQSYTSEQVYPERLGVNTGLNHWQTLFFPFRKNASSLKDKERVKS